MNFKTSFLLCGLAAASFLVSARAADFAPDGVPFTVAETAWTANGLGNHRAVVRVPTAGQLALARLQWRRTDPQPEIKKVFVVAAATGKAVAHAVAHDVTAEAGIVEFEPSAGAGDYYIYYLPYRERTGSHEGRGQPWWNDYFKADYSADAAWRTALGKVQATPCEVVRYESRTDFEAWTPMGLAATAAETKALRLRHPENPVVFTEDRTFPVHPAAWLPAKWAASDPQPAFAGTALKDEYYVWQIALWTPGGALEKVKLAFSDLVSATGERLAATRLTCFNTEGVNWDGSPLAPNLKIPAGRVQPLWCGLDVPANAVPGTYRGTATLTAQGLAPRTVALTITVANETVRDRGDSDLWRLSRLRWLNSRIGESDEPVKPYAALGLNGRTITATGKTVTLGGNGLPVAMTADGNAILRAAMRFVVVTANGEVAFTGEDLALRQAATGLVTWQASAKKNGLSFSLTGRMEFDGFLRYRIAVASEKDESVKDVRLETVYTPVASKYLMGIGYQGRRGGERPAAYTWNWKGPFDSYWAGGAHAGLHVEFRGGTYHGPLIADVSYHPAPPPAWANGGKGTIAVDGTDAMRVVAATGATALSPTARTWEFDLLLTPVKPLDTKAHFNMRFYHANHEGFDNAAQRGANILNIHHAKSLNPVINYPFVVQQPLKDYISSQHAKGRKVKLYYTIRELSNHVAELQALRSLGGEVIAPGNAHGAPWLWEHMGEGYRPAWYVKLTDHTVNCGGETVDAAFVLSPHSRWINYYLEGLRWMFENYQIDGIYMDDVSFDRTVMKRMRRIIERYRPGAIIDLHSNTGYSKGPANQYTDFFPYVDRLWFGESFRYNEMPPDEWFVTFSGIPFGLMGEMLQGGGNPWLGMVYGTTRRYYGAVTEHNPTAIWKMWTDFGIDEARMVGYWEENPPIATDSRDVKATAFIRDGRTLVAIGNFAKEPRTTKLAIDWARLGLNPATATITAPAIPDYQNGRTFAQGEAITIPAKQGWLLLLK